MNKCTMLFLLISLYISASLFSMDSDSDSNTDFSEKNDIVSGIENIKNQLKENNTWKQTGILLNQLRVYQAINAHKKTTASLLVCLRSNSDKEKIIDININ